MKRLFSTRFGALVNILTRLVAVFLLLVPMLDASVTPVKALSFPAELNKIFTPAVITVGEISKPEFRTFQIE